MGPSSNSTSKLRIHGIQARWLNLLIKVGIIITAYWALYAQIFRKHKLDDLLTSFDAPAQHPHFVWLALLVLILMLVNWSLEAAKWRLLVLKVQNLSLLTSFKAVLAGITVSMFTPNRTGEFFGRIFLLEHKHRWEGVFITIVGSMSQLLVTLLIGTPMFYMFLRKYPSFQDEWIVSTMELGLIPITVLGILILLMFLNIGILTRWANRLIKEEWVKLRRYLQVFGYYGRKELLPVLGLSAMRYLVFSSQFLLLLWLFGIPLSTQAALVALPSIFLITTVFPSLTLAELGLRGTASAFVLDAILLTNGSYGASILAAAGSLWLINLVIPALVGTLIISRMKFVNAKRESES